MPAAMTAAPCTKFPPATCLLCRRPTLSETQRVVKTLLCVFEPSNASMEAASASTQAVKSPRPQQPKSAAAVVGAAAATDKAAAQAEEEAQALAKRQAEVRLTCTFSGACDWQRHCVLAWAIGQSAAVDGCKAPPCCLVCRRGTHPCIRQPELAVETESGRCWSLVTTPQPRM